MLKHALPYLCFIAAFTLLLSGCALDIAQTTTPPEQAAALSEELQPGPNLSPGDVIKIQVEALQYNNSQDAGIAVTFRFASAANKHVTGPLNRFKRLLKSPDYKPMLNHKTAEYGPLEISDNTATQRVTIIDPNGKASIYLFELSKQTSGPCQNCWMTDSVIAVPTRKQKLEGA